MKSFIISSIVLISISFSSYSQKKELSLSDAVLQQYRSLSPEKLYGFSWLPETNKYAFFDNRFTTLFLADVSNTTPKKIIDVKEISKVLNEEIKYFGGLEWVDKDNFIFSNGGKYFIYDILKNSGKLLFEFDDKAENIAYNIKNKMFEYKYTFNCCFRASIPFKIFTEMAVQI